MRRLAVVMVLALVGCATPAGPSGSLPSTWNKPGFILTMEQEPRVTLTPAQVEAVKAGVTQKLRDPKSAMFGDMIASKGLNGAVLVCGTVNAKNGFGG